MSSITIQQNLVLSGSSNGREQSLSPNKHSWGGSENGLCNHSLILSHIKWIKVPVSLFILPIIISHEYECSFSKLWASWLKINQTKLAAILVEKTAVQVWDRRINSISYETDSGQISQEVYFLHHMHSPPSDKKIDISWNYFSCSPCHWCIQPSMW